jgi:hypothetical protein
MGATAAAVLSVPRLPELLLLEERHRAGEALYEPRVTAKEQASHMYEQAAASSTHSATLSDTHEDAFAIKLDKLGAGATATFTVKFLQATGLRGCAAVLASSDSEDERIADVAVAPGFTSLAGAGVPFSFSLLHDAAFAVVLPAEQVRCRPKSRRAPHSHAPQSHRNHAGIMPQPTSSRRALRQNHAVITPQSRHNHAGITPPPHHHHTTITTLSSSR